VEDERSTTENPPSMLQSPISVGKRPTPLFIFFSTLFAFSLAREKSEVFVSFKTKCARREEDGEGSKKRIVFIARAKMYVLVLTGVGTECGMNVVCCVWVV